MPKFNRKTAILSRQFELSGSNVVRALVWKPVRAGYHHDHDCYFQIKGIDGINGDKFYFARGVDSIHALTMAMHLLASFLYNSDAWQSGQLTWFGDRDLNLPEFPGQRFGEPIAD